MAMLCAKITKMTGIKKQAPFKQYWVDETDFLQIGNASLASQKMPFCQYKSQEFENCRRPCFHLSTLCVYKDISGQILVFVWNLAQNLLKRFRQDNMKSNGLKKLDLNLS